MVDPDKNNQDNAPVEDSDDTKTRKTVRLRPSVTPAGINLTPLPKAPLTDPLSGRDTDTGNLEVMEDTQTRRTVKLNRVASAFFRENHVSAVSFLPALQRSWFSSSLRTKRNITKPACF